MPIPPILCVTGPSGSGKTHLLERLVFALAARGLRVATVKHSGRIEVSAPGKDSARLRSTGADPSIVVSRDGCLVEGGGEASLLDAVATFCPSCDLVLAEGYGRSVHDKIQLVEDDAPSRAGPMESVRLRVAQRGEFDVHRDDTPAVASWVAAWLERRWTLREGLIGAVLTGGQSTRMGTDKSGLMIAGRAVLVRLYELLADWLGEAWVVGRRPAGELLPVVMGQLRVPRPRCLRPCTPESPDPHGCKRRSRGTLPPMTEGLLPLCARWHLDAAPRQGPLGGIATALRIASARGGARGVCVVACDMPAFGGELLEHLLAARRRRSPATALVHPRSARAEPLAAIYEGSALPSIEQALAAGHRSPTAWLEAAGAHLAPAPDRLADQLANANTPGEWEAIRSRLEGKA